MLSRILKDLGITSVLCLGERLLERFLFPGLHRTPGRMAAADPTRADDMTTLVAEWLGLLALVWLFLGALYAIGWLTRRPLKPNATMLVTTVLLAIVFGGAYAQWATTPMPTPLR
jgi:hypothetical protein